MGGLGNQMFQYAIALSLSKKFNVPFSVDLSYLMRRDFGEIFVYRDYDLDVFDINPNFEFSDIDLEIVESFFEYDKDLENQISSNLDKNILLKGQWQTPIYFDEDIVREHFQFKNPVEKSDIYTYNLLHRISNSNSVMINVRRTDYLNTDFHGVFGLEYIQNAVSVICEKVENPEYFIFSDDVEWCQNNIKLPNMTIVSHRFKGNKFSYYLQLMINCKHFIIPNSSFAWWSAWLNKYTEKIVIAPKRWFNRDEINTSDLIPDSWIRI